MNDESSNSEEKTLLERKLSAIFAGFDGSGLIIAFWMLSVLMLGGIMLLIIGALNVNWIPFFVGLISLRLYIYIAKINREYIDNLRPFDG